MSTVTTDDDDANEADKEAELLVDPRDPRERKEPLDFELRSDALDEDDASDEFDGDERKGIEWMKLRVDGRESSASNTVVKQETSRELRGQLQIPVCMHQLLGTAASGSSECATRARTSGFRFCAKFPNNSARSRAFTLRRPPRGTPICSRSL